MLTCSELTRLHASDALPRAPLSQRLGVRIHLIWCRHCRRYVRQLSLIGALAREALGSDPEGDPEGDPGGDPDGDGLGNRTGAFRVTEFDKRIMADVERIARAMRVKT